MLYAIFAEDVPDSASLRATARPAHMQRLQDLVKVGRLVIAGPHPAIDSPDPGPAGFSGSLIVAEFASLAAAREWAEADPFVAAGAYANVLVKPFRQVLP
ncbi:MAG: YciI family protein [Gammaproteobacteria bacterium]